MTAAKLGSSTPSRCSARSCLDAALAAMYGNGGVHPNVHTVHTMHAQLLFLLLVYILNSHVYMYRATKSIKTQ